ncbi:MAG: 2Fe-2S iron-sulfur cluster binding domain-containing protein [Alphaproteobacteria bacterium]|jgi:ring-1,2-phenylacetyl-CoA epoxidase subunit PaaE|nr:2Fe-2S iron-sulfur cluster binding domain-containing protein [Alphaproteobacteria bacterium]
MSSRGFKPLTVKATRPETADGLVVAFDMRPALAFAPGQYLTLRAEINGAAEQRCYSICSAPGDPVIEVAIKRVPGGRFSEWAHENLKPGATLDVMAPEGRFGCSPGSAPARRYLAIAAGSGITPVISLARTLLAAERSASFTLVYGNRDMASIMFREALDDLKDRYMARFSAIHILSRELQDVDLFNGHINGPRLQALTAAGLIAPADADLVFVCGPTAMMDAVEAALPALGADPACIQTERFLPTPGAAIRAPDTADTPPEGARVTAIYDGTARTFQMVPGESSAILAAERAGIDLPSSCRGGMCCTCRARVVEGKAEMAVNYSLEDWELEAGFILTCQSWPTTPTLTLDFDDV